MLSTKEAAEYLGISVTGFFSKGFTSRLKRLRWGKHKDLYDIQDLDRLIEEQKRESSKV